MTRVDLPRLENFIAHLPKRPRHVLEFRAEGWYRDEVCALLDRHGVAFCEHDHLARRPPFFTGGFRYLRFHGRTGRYEGRYGRRALAPHAESLVEWTEGGRHAFVYFNNDLQGHALRDALDLSALVSQQDKAEPAARLA